MWMDQRCYGYLVPYDDVVSMSQRLGLSSYWHHVRGVFIYMLCLSVSHRFDRINIAVIALKELHMLH